MLYIVATPIGNLGDLTIRALDVLKDADLILCEDTRVTRKLLERFGIQKPTMSYHHHSKLEKVGQIMELLRAEKKIALVSDAGTPGISDPGNKLVEEVARHLPEVAIIPIPGASAVAAVASISGFPMDRFLFLGYPPQKKKRKKYFEEVVSSLYPVVFYESPFRIRRTLEELQRVAPDIKIVVGRELTKKFETIYRGMIEEVLMKLGDSPKGEFVVIAKKFHSRVDSSEE
ncbi:MAG: 16S rRNA (cytidine(1402)-2'-O)-methyltransferase [Candidatus Wildermuthbacteria bacterium RIFCSPHIGHO2_01_FULL_45_20]|uniref:Ribosomal RNA small subunit methyltransferase I n=1 Tax=Candidatus Wildermuthbacteria bacterium RIFCSPHIGHO2_02_FULL_45_25 TaxID=1802450 RepID=A0A1G2R3Y3_9BACT|nr:MAG: 16S rRNA (cytidine(1402)-2'-O)-methyltransferase [Candidatus Wildermuthbacteria bacterium RIFCSPHIGHO2_01_FULL_45_20]OHA67575.1 MAG: 16S rRNA (cytidine(1402)-2'-O)-methyltransferase [Candidatus Wildermuthbacteria bacterium RIFCSPHIGHO2_02_FULL_45_25]